MARAMPTIRPLIVARLLLLIAIAFLASIGLAQAQVAPDPATDVLQGILGDGEGLSGTVIQLFLFVTVLSLVPGIAMMVTCLPFMVIVFSILRQALGVQQAPPNMMIMALAMFLTFFIMEPVFMEAWTNGLSPYIDGALTEQEAWQLTTEPFREFMTRRTDPEAMMVLSDALNRPVAPDAEPSFPLLATSFMLSEIKHAFQIGFVIFMPFMVIDLVVASVLMAVGMMMVPPTVVSLPFKLGFFVLADGWLKITEALLRGYA
ncbi:MAG: flagellar type III secretion system pore protein FliP [Pseudomonadota bacterium]